MPSPTQSRLTALPADVQQLIFAAIDAPSPLFIPKYHSTEDEAFVYGALEKKHQEYYGDDLSDDQLLSSTALLNWSATCRFYRSLLGPLIFKDLVLRSRSKSLVSCTTLRDTDHWHSISSMVVCGTYVIEGSNEEDPEQEPRTHPLDELNFDALSSFLSNLPPNLTKLTLDFPTEWIDECNSDYLEVFCIDEQPETTLEEEGVDKWRKLIFTVFDAVSKNEMSSKEDFELCLFNIPPLPCSVYWSSEFQHLLNHVSRFVLSFSHFDNKCGLNLNTMDMPAIFASRLDVWFWNHLTSVRSLSIHADDSWPFGLAPGRCHIPLALPDSKSHFQCLLSLSLKWWFVDRQLIALLITHMPALKRLTMISYFANSEHASSSDARDRPSWAKFFLALTKHPTLTHFILFPHLSGYRLLDPDNETNGKLPVGVDDSYRTAYEEIQMIEALCRSEKEVGTWTAIKNARMKRIWPHVQLDYKYGMIFDADQYNAVRFNEAYDHEAWLRLCDTLEKRGGGCEVTDAQSVST